MRLQVRCLQKHWVDDDEETGLMRTARPGLLGYAEWIERTRSWSIVWDTGAWGFYEPCELDLYTEPSCLVYSGPLVASGPARLRHERTTAWVALPSQGGAVRLFRGVLEHAPLWDDSWMDAPGPFAVYDHEGARFWIDPEETCDVDVVDHTFLAEVNAVLGTAYCVRDFAHGLATPRRA